jgi:4'-phosphopantetheinyl transferase
MVVSTQVKSGPLGAVTLMRPRGVIARRARTEVWVIKMTEEGPLGLRAARVLLGGADRSARRRRDDRDRSLLARATLMRLLATRADTDAASVVIDHDEAGRPIVRGNDRLMLAVAHSGEFVACAVSTRRVGVDIERSDRVEADYDLARLVCTPHERRELERLPVPLHRAALIRLWTRKEAVVKALGVGLAIAPGHVDVSRDRPIAHGAGVGALRVCDLTGGPDGYAVAVATETRRTRVRAHLIVADAAWSMPARATPSRLRADSATATVGCPRRSRHRERT